MDINKNLTTQAILASLAGISEKKALDVISKVDNFPYLGSEFDLSREFGLTPSKAKKVFFCLSLLDRFIPKSVDKIGDSKDVFNLPQLSHLNYLPHEEIWAVFLNQSNKVIKCQFVSKGGVAGTVGCPKTIFRLGLELSASALILVHNHPSGNHRPSQADIDLTKKIKLAGENLELRLLDHIIFVRKDERTSYFSFNDEGML